METTTLKVVLAGVYLKASTYKYPISYGYERTKRVKLPKEEKSAKTNNERQYSMQMSLYRAKMTLRHLIAVNSVGFINPATKLPYKPIFLTLTFKDNVTDLQQANREFKKFIQRLNYDLKLELKYLTVPEVQKGRLQKYGVAVWHFHTIFFNLPFVDRIYDKFRNIWGQGHVIVKSVNDVNHLANYVAKYLTKDFTTEFDLKNQKRYFCSKELIKPMVIRTESLAKEILGRLPLSANEVYKKKSRMWDGNEITTGLYHLWGDQNAKELFWPTDPVSVLPQQQKLFDKI